VYIYGSFPNGLADLNGDFDFDLALSKIQIAARTNHLPDDFHMRFYGVNKAGSRALERAGLKVLKERLGVSGYDPKAMEHGSISIEKMHKEGLVPEVRMDLFRIICSFY
jgi:hypothetical protein